MNRKPVSSVRISAMANIANHWLAQLIPWKRTRMATLMLFVLATIATPAHACSLIRYPLRRSSLAVPAPGELWNEQ
jgi:hypothetical protein